VDPLLFALAMAVDGIAALRGPRCFDRIGIRTMVLATIGLRRGGRPGFLGNYPAAVGMACGGGDGAQESVMRAHGLAPGAAGRRATALGIMNAVYGVAWFLPAASCWAFFVRSLDRLPSASLGAAPGGALPIFAWLAARGALIPRSQCVEQCGHH